MQAPSFVFGDAEPMQPLVDVIREVELAARRAAIFADGEYIPQMPRELELDVARFDARRAVAGLEQLGTRLFELDAAADAVRIAKRALVGLGDGLELLVEPATLDEDLIGGGVVVLDSVATANAGARFRESADLIRGLADLAELEAMTPDELLRGLSGS